MVKTYPVEVSWVPPPWPWRAARSVNTRTCGFSDPEATPESKKLRARSARASARRVSGSDGRRPFVVGWRPVRRS